MHTLLLFFSLSYSFINDEIWKKRHLRKRQLLTTADSYSYQYFDQKVDHFTPSNTDTFQQRYVVFDKYYDDSHILLFYLNGEAEMAVNTAEDGYYQGLN